MAYWLSLFRYTNILSQHDKYLAFVKGISKRNISFKSQRWKWNSLVQKNQTKRLKSQMRSSQGYKAIILTYNSCTGCEEGLQFDNLRVVGIPATFLRVRKSSRLTRVPLCRKFVYSLDDLTSCLVTAHSTCSAVTRQTHNTCYWVLLKLNGRKLFYYNNTRESLLNVFLTHIQLPCSWEWTDWSFIS